MKKAILVTLALLTGSSVVFSQAPRFGLDLGFSLNRGEYEPDEGIDRRFFGGFDGGMLVEFSIGQRLKIQPEVNYSIVGVELNDGISERTLKLQYITIPLLAKLNVIRGLNLIAGPQHSILLSAWNDPSGGALNTNKRKFQIHRSGPGTRS